MHSRWRIPFCRDAVYAVLADPGGYESWWPQVHDTHALDATSGEARFRSLLPVSLYVRLTHDHIDPATGTLRAHLDGDLAGWSQWTVTASSAHPQHSVVEFNQQVDFTKHVAPAPLWLLRPVLHVNHRYMMWSGRRGLLRQLVGTL